MAYRHLFHAAVKVKLRHAASGFPKKHCLGSYNPFPGRMLHKATKTGFRVFNDSVYWCTSHFVVWFGQYHAKKFCVEWDVKP